MVALPQMAASTVDNILTKSKYTVYIFGRLLLRLCKERRSCKIVQNFLIMKHSKYTTNDWAKLKTGPGSSAPLLCGVRKNPFLRHATILFSRRSILPPGRSYQKDEQALPGTITAVNFLSPPLIDTARLVTRYICHPLLFLHPSSCFLYSPSSSLLSIFVYTTKGKGLSSVRSLLSSLQIV